MPIYEYECTKCKLVSESLQKMDTMTIKCNKCGKKAKKIISSLNKYQIKGFGTTWSAEKEIKQLDKQYR